MDSRHQCQLQQPSQQQQSLFYAQSQFTAQSEPSSARSSAFQSTSSLSSVQISNNQTSMMQGNGIASAPLPSPASTKGRQQSTCYFGSSNQGNGPTSHPQQPHAHGHHMASSSRLPPQQQFTAPQLIGQRGGQAGGAPETASFLMEANLLAEAAKRAQIACLMRDMDDIAL